MSIISRKNKREEIDEHDLPTEPLPRLVLAPFATHQPGDSLISPSQLSGGAPILPPMHNRWVAFLPAGPGRPKFEAYPTIPYSPVPPITDEKPFSQEQVSWQSPVFTTFLLRRIPFGVGMCFVGVQMLLLVRFIFKICQLAAALSWVNVVYLISDSILAPFHALLPPLTAAIFIRIEPYTLLALVCYGLCSRVIVHLLKLIFNTHFFEGTRVS